MFDLGLSIRAMVSNKLVIRSGLEPLTYGLEGCPGKVYQSRDNDSLAKFNSLVPSSYFISVHRIKWGENGENSRSVLLLIISVESQKTELLIEETYFLRFQKSVKQFFDLWRGDIAHKALLSGGPEQAIRHNLSASYINANYTQNRYLCGGVDGHAISKPAVRGGNEMRHGLATEFILAERSGYPRCRAGIKPGPHLFKGAVTCPQIERSVLKTAADFSGEVAAGRFNSKPGSLVRDLLNSKAGYGANQY